MALQAEQERKSNFHSRFGDGGIHSCFVCRRRSNGMQVTLTSGTLTSGFIAQRSPSSPPSDGDALK